MASNRGGLQVSRLSWGVKQSFRNYVEAAGGTIETRSGAERDADGTFVFNAAPESALELDAAGAPHGRGAFAGEVAFEAHGGMLRVRLADPVLEFGPAGALLTLADGADPSWRVALARLDLAAMTADASGGRLIPAALTIDGIQLLGDHYAPNTPLDPVRLILAG